MRFALLSLSVVLLSSSFTAHAKMYKWVDENGQMHFGDAIPEKYLVKQHDELNEQGMVVKHKDAAKTAEEKAEEKRLEKERKKAELIAKKKKQRDRVLLDTYTTESDLVVARKSRLEAVDTQILLADTIISASNNKIESLEERVTSIEASNREVPPDLYELIESEKHQVTVQSKVMENHKKRRDEISVQFDDYIERFKVLKAEQKAKRERRAKERAQSQ
jgi:methionine-rich copper-binding protein CopC